MSRKRKVIIGSAAGLFLCLLLTAALWFLQSQLRSHLLDTSPLVLMLSPHSGEEFAADELVTVHAMAREITGLGSIELWVDGELITSRAVGEDSSTTMLVLHEGLQALTAGRHEIIVRATSSWGSTAQAGSWFTVLAGGGERGILAAAETSAGAPPASGVPASPSSAPRDLAPAPGSVSQLVDWLHLPSGFRGLGSASGPLLLRLEVLSLQTDQAYPGLHCYIGAARIPPRWFPDSDYDQSTDESFAGLGDGLWDVGADLNGEDAPLLVWDSGDPIPLQVTCVALTSGGTDALELGSLVTSIGPEEWDGVTRRYDSSDLEGHFAVDLRVTPVEEAPPWYPLALDLDMTPPINLTMGFWTLYWDYEPRPDEDEIDGFRIKLNEDVVWTEAPDARQSYLPYEWLSPPCGTTFTFTVDAIRGEDWSLPSNPVIIAGGEVGSEECDRTLILTFDTLETFDVPNDEDHDGWVGPLSGSFYVGEQEIRFDSHCSGSGYCDYYGIGDNEQIGVSRLTSYWGPGPARFVVHTPPGEDLEIGFEIRDHDGGRSQVLCGRTRILEDWNLDRGIESWVGSSTDNCRVSFSIHPALGSVVADPEGPYPLPQLGVTDLTVNDETGQLRVHVRNFGRASWPAHDLEIAVLRREGPMFGTYTFEELVLRPGESEVLTIPDPMPLGEPPLAFCVVLDPANRVPEEVDRTDVWSREPFCRGLPDLTITDVRLEEEQDRLLVTVRNIGPGSLDGRMVDIALRFQDAFPLTIFENISLDPWQSRVLIWEGLPAETLERIQGRTTVLVDSRNRIAEVDEENNAYELQAGGEYRLRWLWTTVPYYLFSDGYGRHVNQDRFYTELRAEAAGASRVVANWRVPRGSGNCEVRYREGGEVHFCQMEFEEQILELHGDESLVIDLRGELTVGPYETGLGLCIWDCEHSLGEGLEVLTPEEWSAAPACEPLADGQEIRMWMYSPDLRGPAWWVAFDLCRVEE
jgi:hypothetical protein